MATILHGTLHLRPGMFHPVENEREKFIRYGEYIGGKNRDILGPFQRGDSTHSERLCHAVKRCNIGFREATKDLRETLGEVRAEYRKITEGI